MEVLIFGRNDIASIRYYIFCQYNPLCYHTVARLFCAKIRTHLNANILMAWSASASTFPPNPNSLTTSRCITSVRSIQSSHSPTFSISSYINCISLDSLRYCSLSNICLSMPSSIWMGVGLPSQWSMVLFFLLPPSSFFFNFWFCFFSSFNCRHTSSASDFNFSISSELSPPPTIAVKFPEFWSSLYLVFGLIKKNYEKK